MGPLERWSWAHGCGPAICFGGGGPGDFHVKVLCGGLDVAGVQAMLRLGEQGGLGLMLLMALLETHKPWVLDLGVGVCVCVCHDSRWG